MTDKVATVILYMLYLFQVLWYVSYSLLFLEFFSYKITVDEIDWRTKIQSFYNYHPMICQKINFKDVYKTYTSIKFVLHECWNRDLIDLICANAFQKSRTTWYTTKWKSHLTSLAFKRARYMLHVLACLVTVTRWLLKGSG